MSQRNTDVTTEPGLLDCSDEIRSCSVLEAIERVTGKWRVGILLAVTPGPTRFTEIEKMVPGISRRMLTLTLRNLERDGLLTRKVYPTVPPKVEYSATAMANELNEALTDLAQWARRHRGRISDSREAYDEANAG